MSVYISKEPIKIKNRSWFKLYSDNKDLLHATAERLGLGRDSYNGTYYSISPPRRLLVLDIGIEEK